MSSLTVRVAGRADRSAMLLLDEVGFGNDNAAAFVDMWRSMTSLALVACDGAQVVGAAIHLDLELTVPGGATLPVAGVSGVVVAPTHRRSGVMRTVLTELHSRIAAAGYPIAALTATAGGIYGRFGYGPATVTDAVSIDRRFAVFHPDAPDPGGVRLGRPADHRDELAALYDRWRRATPGGLLRPPALWDEVLADRAHTRAGGTALFALLHPEGYALYRVHAGDPMSVRVQEFRAVTGAAHAALWRALLGLDLMRTVDVRTHPDDALPYLLTDPRVPRAEGRRDGLWLRLMDIPAALQARGYRGELSTVIEVSGGGRFALEIRDGRARCAPTGQCAAAQLGLDVLGSLYLGAHRASALAAAGRLRCTDPELVQRLDIAFGSDVPAQLGFSF